MIQKAKLYLTGNDAGPVDWSGVCEHGDHPAPVGARYCSSDCCECDATTPTHGYTCAGLCGEMEPDGTQEIP